MIDTTWQAIFSKLDLHFARCLQELSHSENADFALAAALSSYFTNQGNVCVDLSQLAGQKFPPEAEEGIICPQLSTWLASLRQHPMVGLAGEFKPLILNGNYLYLYRYWQYEQQLRINIMQRIALDLTNLAAINTPDEQDQAVYKALNKSFYIISGGPGTGKTTTVVKLLISLLTDNPQLRIALAAPTGKAASRLQQVMQEQLPPNFIQPQTYTIHRLLGTIGYSNDFRANAHNPLTYDVIIVDEASMIGLSLMTKLAAAIKLSTKWLLLGDKDQLASVEAGSVFGDLCQHLSQDAPDNISLLTVNYRFNKDSGIGILAAKLRAAQAEAALNTAQKFNQDLQWHDLAIAQDLAKQLSPLIINGFKPYLICHEPQTALDNLAKFRVLCATRRGSYGVERVNQLIEQILLQNNYINMQQKRWYHGKPIMITRNDYSLNLFNGDIGVILLDEEYKLMAYFRDAEGKLRSLHPQRLPEHETAYTITVHKSQGSEFEQVLLLLPDCHSPLLSRELLYTAVTRAKSSLHICATTEVFLQTAKHSIDRQSGWISA